MPVENTKDDSNEEIEIVVEQDEGGGTETNAKPDGSAEADTGRGKAAAETGAAAEESQGKPVGGEEGELEQYSEGVKRRIAKLTGKMREAERQREAAVEYARSIQKQKEDTDKRVQTVEAYHLREWGERLKAQEVLLRGALTRAIETGDTAKQVETQKLLSDLSAEQRTYQSIEAQRQNAAGRVQTPVQTPQQQVQQPVQPDAKAQAWASRNEWFGQDEAMTVTAFAHHKKLVEQEGVDPTSDEYYRELDRRMREDFPQKFQPARTQAPARQNTVAPAVRTVQQAGAKPQQVVKLSPSQVAIAKKLGVPLEQYARQVAKLNREG